MRHIGSLLAGVVAAPLAWLFLATGQHRSARTVIGWDNAGAFDTSSLVGPVIFLGAAGILLGVLGTLRWSPAGPVATGLIFVLPTIFMFASPFRTLDAFSFDETRRLFGQDFQPWLPLQNGTLLVIGVMLLIAVFSAERWRQWPTRLAAVPAVTDRGATPAAGSLSSSSSQEPSSRTQEPSSRTQEPSSRTQEPSSRTQEVSMSDDEILAAAAAMDEQQAGGTGAKPTEPQPGAPEPKPEPEPDTGAGESETPRNESDPR